MELKFQYDIIISTFNNITNKSMPMMIRDTFTSDNFF